MATSIQERRQLERQQRRRKIQRVARRIFAERGFAGATIEEIARKSSLSVGAIYLYFRSKEELYVSLLQDSLELLAEEVGRIPALAPDARAALRGVWDRFLEFAETFKEFHRVVLLAGEPAAREGVSAEVVSALGRAAGRSLLLIEAIIDKGIEHGVYRADCQRAAAELLWASFLGLVALGEARTTLELVRPHDDSTPAELGWREHFETLERGLLA
jgi:AcrR family transcriptional regulator